MDAMNQQLRECPDVAVYKEYRPTFGVKGDGSKTEKTGQMPNGKMFGVGYVGGLSDFGKTAYDFLDSQLDKEVRWGGFVWSLSICVSVGVLHK